MDGRLSLLLVAGLALGLFLPQGEACSCAMQHPQDHFCSSDFGELSSQHYLPTSINKQITDSSSLH